LAPVAIPRSADGAPRWPAGVVGSITHCDGYAASAVAWRREVTCLGVDAEPADALPAGVLTRIASDDERASLRELASVDATVWWDRLLFSAKEAVYKAWYPLIQRRLAFKDASIVFDPTAGTFGARLLLGPAAVPDRRVTRLAGRWLQRDGLIVTAVADLA
jgi:4'-phosphopantetheinyl transferase EntD